MTLHFFGPQARKSYFSVHFDRKFTRRLRTNDLERLFTTETETAVFPPPPLPFISPNPVWQRVRVSKWFKVGGGFRNETVIDHRSTPPSPFPPIRETLSSVSFRAAGDKLYPPSFAP